MSLANDRRVVLAVVCIIGLFALVSLTGILALALRGQAVPSELNTLGGTALGALAAILVSTHSGGGDPVPVSGPAGPSDPVNVQVER